MTEYDRRVLRVVEYVEQFAAGGDSRKWADLTTKHGLGPKPEPAASGEGNRWFKDEKSGRVREYPSRKTWDSRGILDQTPTVVTMEMCIRTGDTELDGPPPHGKPLATQPAPPPVYERWFAAADTVRRGNHQKGKHLTWRIRSDDSGGRYWLDGKGDHLAAAYKTFARAEAGVARGDLIELDPATGEPMKASQRKSEKDLPDDGLEDRVRYGPCIGDNHTTVRRVADFVRAELASLVAENKRLTAELAALKPTPRRAKAKKKGKKGARR